MMSRALLIFPGSNCFPRMHSVHSELLEMRVFSSVQSLSHVRLLATPWTAARQASLSITNSQSLLKLMSIELVTPSNHLILCHPLLLLPSIFPSIRVFSNESVLCIRECSPEHKILRCEFSVTKQVRIIMLT